MTDLQYQYFFLWEGGTSQERCCSTWGFQKGSYWGREI